LHWVGYGSLCPHQRIQSSYLKDYWDFDDETITGYQDFTIDFKNYHFLIVIQFDLHLDYLFSYWQIISVQQIISGSSANAFRGKFFSEFQFDIE